MFTEHTTGLAEVMRIRYTFVLCVLIIIIQSLPLPKAFYCLQVFGLSCYIHF